MTRSSQAQLDPVLVRDELQRILQSGCLPAGSMLAKILSYVVERTLDGDGKSIKAYTIAVEALGRSADFDPDRDSTVRVAAMRLRAALDLYYAEAGATNELRIRMVPGCYRPTFELAERTVEDETQAPTAHPAPLSAPPPGLLAHLRVGLPSTRIWLAAISTILALDLAMTVSLMAVQLRGAEVASAHAATPAPEKAVRLGADKQSATRAAAVYDLIQHQVQASFAQDAH
jgi:hypothetical protein